MRPVAVGETFILKLKIVFVTFLRKMSDQKNIQTMALWLSAIVCGGVAVGYAVLFRICESAFLYMWTEWGGVAWFIPPALFLLAWAVVRLWAPEAAGSGIPQILAANEFDFASHHRGKVERLLSLKTAILKIISSLLCALGGGAIGREGPTLQISTSLFYFFGKIQSKYVSHFSEQTWIVAGAASGLAAAFNTPLGGIVYAIEELGLVHFNKIRTAVLSGVIVSGLVAQWLLGSYLYLGYPQLANIGPFAFLFAILNGLITGVLGALWGKLLFCFLQRRLAVKKTSQLALLTFVSGLIMTVLMVIEPRSYGSGNHIINSFLFENNHSSLLLVISRVLSTMTSYLSGAAGGIFSPSLTIGATLGKYLTLFFGSGYPNLMPLLGMIGFLTGVTRTPFTSFILVLEMTDHHSAIFPMMMAALAAYWAAQWVEGKSFYERVKEEYFVLPGTRSEQK